MLCLLALATQVAGQPGSAQDTKARLLGAWRLVQYEIFNQNGTTAPGNFDTGLVTYDGSGQMSAHLMRAKDRPSGTPRTDSERSTAYQTYLGYFGPFTVDESKGMVVHHVVGSSYPHWVGTDQVRYFVLSPDGNRLTLSLKSGERISQTLTWERVR